MKEAMNTACLKYNNMAPREIKKVNNSISKWGP